MEINFGAYSIPIILTVFLSLIYKCAGGKIPDRWKALIAVVIGIGLGLLSISYTGKVWDIVTVVDGVVYGLMVGASSTGLYELQRTVTNPRK